MPALAVSSLNPRDSAALPLIIECLTIQDQEIQRDALQAIQIAAEAEMDVTAAVPGLIEFLGHCQAELASKDVENQYLHGTVGQTLRLIGVRAEDVPRLRQILTETFQTTRTGDDEIQTRKREMSATLIAGLISVLGSVQPPAVDALREIQPVVLNP